jgi:MutS domain V
VSESIEAEYARRLAALGDEFDRSSARGSTLTFMLLGALVVLVYVGYQALAHGEPAWRMTVPVGVMLGLAPALMRARHQAQRAGRLLRVYERGAARVDGSETQSGHTGEAFSEAGHLYERDLGILGRDSIFGMLATTRTMVGQRALARLLLHGGDIVPPGLKPGFVAGENVRAEARTLQGEAVEARTLQGEAVESRSLQDEGAEASVLRGGGLSEASEVRSLQDDVRARQVAVRELAPMLDLRERVALLGRSAFDEVPAESFDRWLDQPRGGLELWMRWALIAMTLAWVGLLVAVLMHRLDWDTVKQNLVAVLAVEGAFSLWLRPRVMSELESSQRLAGQTAILRDGLRVLQGEKFSSELLRGLQRDVAEDDIAAGEMRGFVPLRQAQGQDDNEKQTTTKNRKGVSSERALKSLSGNLMLVEQRAKEWFYAPGLLLAVGSHAAISLEVWKREHGDAMRRWVSVWAEFEALLAVATYAAEHPENVYPEIVEGGVRFDAEGLAHPLLPASVAVRNDVRLDAATRFLLISGSNMAGKSTLLRAVGCNVVLALAGAPVCARSVTMSALRVGASLALVDSLAEGKSKFLAEVERLRDLVALAKAHPGNMLFLIDEIFSGTNSADRRAAAEAVLRGLVREGAIGALSTHDLALAELAEVESLHGLNVHMASPDESDPLGFDYLLKPGVNRTTNAMAIVKMLGLA